MSKDAVKTLPPILLVPRGAFDDEAKKVLREVGYVAIETDDPSKVIATIPTVPFGLPISADSITLALLEALATSASGSAALTFVKSLHRQVAQSRTTAKAAKP
jgi:hypothetical protein